MLMVPKATEGQFDVNGFRRLLVNGSEGLKDNLMLMVPKATEGQFDVNGSEGY